MQNSKNQTIRQSVTYDTIRGQFLQDQNWSRFRPTELHNFAKNVGVLGKRKSLKCLIFRDLPNLKSFKSGATRNRIKLISDCISLSLYSAKGLISRYCSTDFLQCFASFSWVIFLYMHKGNRIHGKSNYSPFYFQKTIHLEFSLPFSHSDGNLTYEENFVLICLFVSDSKFATIFLYQDHSLLLIILFR